jgi:hypothetical protein
VGSLNFNTPVRLAPQLTISLFTQSDSGRETTCRLLHDGRDTGAVLSGALLEAALEASLGWVAFLTHDVPYEEGLEIYLLSKEFEVLDHASIAAPYATGVFENLEIISPTMVRFEFIGERPWLIELRPHPALRIPLLSEPTGVLRRLGFRRHFRISHP